MWNRTIVINVTVLSKYFSNKDFRGGPLEYEAILNILAMFGDINCA
jgi:hypothetical protein